MILDESKPGESRIDPEVIVAQDYKFVFTTGEGKRVLADLCARFSMFDAIRGDWGQMAFQEGQRSVVVFINQFVRADLNELSDLVVRLKRGG